MVWDTEKAGGSLAPCPLAVLGTTLTRHVCFRTVQLPRRRLSTQCLIFVDLWFIQQKHLQKALKIKDKSSSSVHRKRQPWKLDSLFHFSRVDSANPLVWVLFPLWFVTVGREFSHIISWTFCLPAARVHLISQRKIRVTPEEAMLTPGKSPNTHALTPKRAFRFHHWVLCACCT